MVVTIDGPAGAGKSTIAREVAARLERVRERMRARQRELASDAVLEGRDTGTRVCPGADVKVYLTASVGERARRRAADLELPVDATERAIAERDRLDAVQLAPAADAHTIDTTGIAPAEVVERVLALVREAGR